MPGLLPGDTSQTTLLSLLAPTIHSPHSSQRAFKDAAVITCPVGPGKPPPRWCPHCGREAHFHATWAFGVSSQHGTQLPMEQVIHASTRRPPWLLMTQSQKCPTPSLLPCFVFKEQVTKNSSDSQGRKAGPAVSKECQQTCGQTFLRPHSPTNSLANPTGSTINILLDSSHFPSPPPWSGSLSVHQRNFQKVLQVDGGDGCTIL